MIVLEKLWQVKEMITQRLHNDCLLDYNYFKNYYKMIAIDLSKQKALDADPKAMQQINFNGDLDQPAGATMFFIIEETKEIVLDFSQETVKLF